MIGVITNCFILGFTSDSFAQANGLSITQRIWVTFIAEHALLLFKIMLAYLIPDVPAEIRREVAKKEWIRECQVAALEARAQQDISGAEEQRVRRMQAREERMRRADDTLGYAEEFDDDY